MTDRLRRNCAQAESQVRSQLADQRACGMTKTDLRNAGTATYRCDVSARYIELIRSRRAVGWIVAQNLPGKPLRGAEADHGRRSEQEMSSQRAGVLELAVLGLLHETPMHGYELRKRLNSFLGAFRAFGYGSLYPCLKELLPQALIAEEQPDLAGKPLAGRRSKIVYRLTGERKGGSRPVLAERGPAAWEPDGFGVRFALFAQTRTDIRLRI